ncbi:MAG: transglutaminase domain-containing protein, partial [Odoribacter sp.]|nr:transglutaminase domain-containing protein [Odoribacter sp.]
IQWTSLRGGYFEASNRADFQNSTIIHRTDQLYTGTTVIPVDTTVAFRYWRYYLEGYHQMAEIGFYDIRKNEMTGKVLLPPEEFIKKYPERLFDHNPLTYALIAPYIGVDFGKPVTLSEIRYSPRNDDNDVVPGQVYELKYHNGHRWISRGQQTARYSYIDFENAPTHALSWLQNLTTGREERFFTYENGKQRFW